MRHTMLVALCLSAMPALALDYPVRPIRLIVPTAPGGASDLISRLLGEEASKILGQPIVIENRPGANGNVGMDWVAKADKDGYAIGNCAIGVCSVNSLFYKMPFDVKRDLTPVVLATSLTNVLVVKNDDKIKTLDDFIKLAKSRELNYGSSGLGSAHHMSSELLGKELGVKFQHIAYRGAAPALTAVMAGELDFMVENASQVVAHLESGALKGLGVTSPKRSPMAPSIPTFAEQGYPKVIVEPWFGFVVPAGTPPEIVARLNQAFNQALELPAIRARFKELGLNPEGGTPERFGEHIDAEHAKWKSIVAAAGITPN
jgi:tripartite-type tricarboxylate transporter receptor subunit TctC